MKTRWICLVLASLLVTAAAVSLAGESATSDVPAPDSHDPLGLVTGLTRVGLYSDEEIDRIMDMLARGVVTRPPGRAIEGRAVAPGEGPLLAPRPDLVSEGEGGR